MLRRTTMLVATMLFLLLPLATSPAKAEIVKKDGEQASFEGCLTKAASQKDHMTRLVDGVWVLTTTDKGDRILLKGDDDLMKYDNDQEVRVSGVWKIDRVPEMSQKYNNYLKVDKVEQLAAHCSAPTTPNEEVGGRK